MSHPNGIAGWFTTLFGKGTIHELEVLRGQLREQELHIQRIEESYKQLPAPIIIEQIKIDKVVVDKMEYHNNFGALGIKELSGKLNIGANYTMSKDEAAMEADGLGILEKAGSAMGKGQGSGQSNAEKSGNELPHEKDAEAGPKVTIKAKPGTDA
jgi:hypothetical protein